MAHHRSAFLASLILWALQLSWAHVAPGQSPIFATQDLASEEIAVDDTWFSDDSTSGTTLLINGDLTLLVPVNDKSNPDNFEDFSTRFLGQSIPQLLLQFGVDDTDIPDLVTQAIPLLQDAIVDAVSSSDPGNSAFRTTDLADDISNLITNTISKATNLVQSSSQNVLCASFVCYILPLYQILDQLLQVANQVSGSATTNDQDFYLFPVHGSISHDDAIQVFYSADLTPILVNRDDAITFGKNIYLNLQYPANTAVVTDPGFEETTKLLLHEFTHSKQYQALGYNKDVFGAKYLFGYCKAGFDEKSNVWEAEAYQKETWMNGIIENGIGKQFLPIYNGKNLQPQIGLPTARTYTALPPPSINQYSLDFQFGSMTIDCTNPAVCV